MVPPPKKNYPKHCYGPNFNTWGTNCSILQMQKWALELCCLIIWAHSSQPWCGHCPGDTPLKHCPGVGLSEIGHGSSKEAPSFSTHNTAPPVLDSLSFATLSRLQAYSADHWHSGFCQPFVPGSLCLIAMVEYIICQASKQAGKPIDSHTNEFESFLGKMPA